MSERVQGAVVIGGGVVGLAAAWHLLRLGCHPVTVIERFRIGHDRGSSHGSVRMTRSTYPTAVYAGLMRLVRDEEWPRLERAAGVALVQPADVVFFGPDRATLGRYAAAVRAAGAAVERLSVAEARSRFRALRFGDDAEVLHDRTGGRIAADRTLRALRGLIASAGGRLLEGTRVHDLDRTAASIRVVTEGGVFHAQRVVIATGAWLPELVPVSREAVTVVPQTVAYVGLGVPADTVPSWIHFGGAGRAVTYGLPEIGRDALKVGHHRTCGPGADPDQPAGPPLGEMEALRRTLEEVLAVPVGPLLGIEACLYTMTPTEDLVIDRWPGDPRVVFAAACSGHGFKFAPLTGRILAELVLHGRADLPGALDGTTLFALHRARHRAT